MVGRVLTAFVGASAITITMLYGMSEIVEIFKRRDPTQYFGIGEVIVRPDDAKPRRIPRAGVQPERGDIEFDRPDVSLDVERPSVEMDEPTGEPRIRPRLDENAD